MGFHLKCTTPSDRVELGHALGQSDPAASGPNCRGPASAAIGVNSRMTDLKNKYKNRINLKLPPP